jgi:hypothetical protein
MKITIEIDTNEPAGDIPALVCEVLADAAERGREHRGDGVINTIVNPGRGRWTLAFERID